MPGRKPKRFETPLGSVRRCKAGAGSVPGALPTLRGARRSPWVPQQLEGTPRSPGALGWGWGSEKPDPNQVQVTFRLELAPGLPQGATASERSPCRACVRGGVLCNAPLPQRAAPEARGAVPGLRVREAMQGREGKTSVHLLSFNENLGAKAQLPQPGVRGTFVAAGVRPCLTVPRLLTSPGAELAAGGRASASQLLGRGSQRLEGLAVQGHGVRREL